MWRRKFFKILGGVFVLPFVPRPPVAPEMYRPCGRLYGPDQPLRSGVTDDPHYEFGFTGFKPAGDGRLVAHVPRQILNTRYLL